MTLGRVALVLALAAACGSGTAAPPLGSPKDLAPVPTLPPGNFHLYVSNQSFDRPTVDIALFIDGVRLAAQDFEVKNQHNWIEFGAELAAGKHQLRAVSDAGETELTQSFTTGALNWAVVDYWCCGEPEDPRFTFTISDQPIGFA
jgi:hypothetical protein